MKRNNRKNEPILDSLHPFSSTCFSCPLASNEKFDREFFQHRSFENNHRFNSFKTNIPHHMETSQLNTPNQVNGFY